MRAEVIFGKTRLDKCRYPLAPNNIEMFCGAARYTGEVPMFLEFEKATGERFLRPSRERAKMPDVRKARRIHPVEYF
jgi:hypothetical protein